MKTKITSFSRKLTLKVSAFTVILLLTILIFVGVVVNSLLTNQVENRTKTALETATLYVNSSLKELESVLENSEWLIKQSRSDTSNIKYITAKVLMENEGIVGSALAFVPEQNNGILYAGFSSYAKHGRKIHYHDLNAPGYDYLTLDWFQIPLQLGYACWSEPYYDDLGADVQMTTYSYPLRDEKGDIYAIFTIDISLQWLMDKASSIKPYPNSRNYIISRAGNFIVSNDDLMANETIFSYAFERQDTLLQSIGKKMISKQNGKVAQFEFEDDMSYAQYGPLDNGWSIILISSYFEAFKPLIYINIGLIILVLIGAIGLYLICNKVVNNVTKPINTFTEIIGRISKNDFQSKLPEVTTNDEIKVLRDAIESLQTTMQENREHRNTLNIARQIQLALVPKSSIKTNVFDLYAMINPAKEVGGDLYDYAYNGGEDLHFMIGDVSGKGISAALFMTMTLSASRTVLGYDMNTSINAIMNRVNASISKENSMNMFVTIFMGCINLKTRTMKFCNAGHNSPIIIDPQGNASYLSVKPNIVAGAVDEFPYEEETVQIPEGSRIILYTDGVVEAERLDKAQYGDDRLLQWASSLPMEMSSEECVKNLREDVRKFTDNGMAPQNDDITIMMIKF